MGATVAVGALTGARAGRARREGGFTLIESMVVVAIIAIIASFALPALASTRKSANEAAALAMVRSLYHAQETYRQKRLPTLSPSGYALQISDLANHGLLPAELTQGQGEDAIKGFHRGYKFYTWGGSSDPRLATPEMFIVAYPESPATGDRAFLLTEDGRIFYRTNGLYFVSPSEGKLLEGS